MKSSQKKTKQITVFLGVVIKDGKVLMNLRNEEECPEAHHKWELPGGKADFGETPQASLEREFLEETGVTVKVKTLLPRVEVSYWEYEWGTQQTLCFGFLCEFVSQKALSKKDHHVEKVEWVSLDRVNHLETLPGTKEMIAAAISQKAPINT